MNESKKVLQNKIKAYEFLLKHLRERHKECEESEFTGSKYEMFHYCLQNLISEENEKKTIKDFSVI